MKKVMVVDDDEHLRRVLGVVLKRGGFDVVLAPDGEECLRKLRDGFQGIVLMDIMMPGLTGWETIRAMLRENLVQGVLICMLTATPAPGEAGEGLENVVFDYLAKPFDNATLLHCLDNAMSFLEA